ncbi:MAG: Ig-like domain-containing protein, partial [Nocardioidaceae bacterium]
LTNDSTPTFTGTAEDGSTVTIYSDGVAVGSGVAVGGMYSITTTVLAEGARAIAATATDAAGNTGPASPGLLVTVDVTAPAAPSAPDLAAASDSGPSTTDNYTNVTTPTFTGTAVTGSTVTLYSGSMVVGAAAVTSGNYTITTNLLAQGAQTFTATAADAAGNTSSTSPGLSVTIDFLAPTVTITSVTYDSGNGRVTTTGTAGKAVGDDGTVTVVLCSQNSFPCTAGDTQDSGQAAVNSTTGGWTFTSKTFQSCILFVCTGSPGQIYVQASQGDQAGNVGVSPVVARNF